MKPLTTKPSSFATSLFILVLALSLILAGCSGGEEEGGSGGSSGSGGSPGTTQASEETASASEEATVEETTAAPEQTREAAPDPPGESTADSSGSTALSGGLDAARSEAESWNGDAELYAIASLRPTVNAEGESKGWLYSFVSESTNSVLSLPYSQGEIQSARGQKLPGGQIERISSTTLSVDDLVDSPEALRRSGEVKSYLEENPDAGASAGMDSASREEPEWILSVPAQGIQNRVPATK